MSISPDSFPLLLGASKSPKRLSIAIDDLSAAVLEDSIRNVELQALKSTLSRAVDDAWRAHVSEPHFYSMQWQDQPMETQELYNSITLMGLHSVISASKKAAKSKAVGPAADAIRAYCAELLPLAQAVDGLKAKVVKGRAPNSAPAKPENPNKVVKTCPCCFRGIAVTGGTMAHHGYRRPGMSIQTASCSGIRFEPLEVSSAGLAWLVKELVARLESRRDLLSRSATEPAYLMRRRVRGGPVEKIERDDPLWPAVFKPYLRELQDEVAVITAELPHLQKTLADWKPGAGGR